MTITTSSTPISARTGLPHWEATPEDIPGAIREIKAAIRAKIEASGRTVGAVIAEIEAFLETRDRRHRGSSRAR